MIILRNIKVKIVGVKPYVHLSGGMQKNTPSETITSSFLKLIN